MALTYTYIEENIIKRGSTRWTLYGELSAPREQCGNLPNEPSKGMCSFCKGCIFRSNKKRRGESWCTGMRVSSDTRPIVYETTLTVPIYALIDRIPEADTSQEVNKILKTNGAQCLGQQDNVTIVKALIFR